jgi:TPR repeat protein
MARAAGRGTAKDEAGAVAAYQRACDGKQQLTYVAWGCNNLAAMLLEGKGARQDVTRARALFERACEGGDAKGCLGAGLIWREGIGVAKDAAKARALIERSCSGGEAAACQLLAAPGGGAAATAPVDGGVGPAAP